MEHERSCSDQEIPNKGYDEHIVMSMFYAVMNTFGGKIHEKQVRQRIYDFGSPYCCIVILVQRLVSGFGMLRRKQTSSHQFSVEVTGDHFPSWAGGYGIEGSHEAIAAAIFLGCFFKRGQRR
jgi:hypothetical protein